VLIIHSLGLNFSPFRELSLGFQRELSRQEPAKVEFFEVSLDSARFTQTESEDPFVAYLSALFRNRPLDLVLSIGDAAARFSLRHRAALFPSTPLLATGTERRLEVGTASHDARSGPRSRSIPGAGREPFDCSDTSEIFLITGALEILAWRPREFQPFGVSVQSFYELADDGRVAVLPPNTAILYGLHTDGAGRPRADEALT
jgi:hypothetical protein